MSVAKKYRRKIIVKEKTYLWVVKQNKDYEGFSLNIFSEDKRFRVSYFLSQADTYLSNLHEDYLPFLTVKGE